MGVIEAALIFGRVRATVVAPQPACQARHGTMGLDIEAEGRRWGRGREKGETRAGRLVGSRGGEAGGDIKEVSACLRGGDRRTGDCGEVGDYGFEPQTLCL